MPLHQDAGILLLSPRLVAASTTCRWLLVKGAELVAPQLGQRRMLRLFRSALEAHGQRCALDVLRRHGHREEEKNQKCAQALLV